MDTNQMGIKTYIFLILTALFINWQFIKLNTAPLHWDGAAHINLSLLYADKLQNFNLIEALKLSDYYPPFVHFVGGLGFTILSRLEVFNLLSYMFAILLVIFASLLFKEILKDRINMEASIFMGLVLVLMPQFYRELHFFRLDLPLTTLVIMGLFALAKSDYFNNIKYTIAFFVLCALAQLTKWYAFIFFVVPLIQIVINWKKLNKISLLLGIAGLLLGILWWYIPNSKQVYSYYSGSFFLGEMNDPKEVFSIANWTEYLKLMTVYQIFLINLVIALLCAIVVFKDNKKAILMALVNILVPYVFFTFIVNKDVRYVMPLIFYMLIPIALAYSYLDKIPRIKPWLAGLFIGINMLLFVIISFNQRDVLPKNLQFLRTLVAGPIQKYDWLRWNPKEFSYVPSKYNLINPSYDAIKAHIGNNSSEGYNILFATDWEHFNHVNFNTVQILNKDRFRVEYVDPGFAVGRLDQFNFVITSDKTTSGNLYGENKMQEVKQFAMEKGQILKTMEMPDGNKFYVIALK